MIRKAAKKVIRRLSANDYQTLNRIELDHQRLLHNIAYMRKRQPHQATIAVLKANAYGHGLIEVATILNGADCAFLAVDGYFEAAQIRNITRHHILVMSYIRPENSKLLDTKRCSFVVQDVAGLRALAKLNRPVRVHMEINTGMFRLGLQPDEIDEYLQTLKQYPKLQLEGVMTHLADADNAKSDTFTAEQCQLFDQSVDHILAAGFKPAYFHLAQSAGSTKAHSRYANAVRLGLGLYGINPLSPADKHFRDLAGLLPVLELKSTLIKTYDLEKGDRVSYNGIFTAPRKMRIGTLPLGYYEGLPRELSNRGYVMAAGRRLPIVGKICMNHTMIDVSKTDLKVGDEVTVISNDPAQLNSIVKVSAAYGLFPYSWLANLSSSVRRIVI